MRCFQATALRGVGAQAQGSRSSMRARQCPRPHRVPAAGATRRPVALEPAAEGCHYGGMIAAASPPTIARLKVSLDDVEPKVVRRLEVPLTIRLDRLHLVLQAAFGWENVHLWEFMAGRDVRFGLPDPDWGDGPLDGRKANLEAAMAKAGKNRLKYLYDFGDGWEHTIGVEATVPASPGILYPRLLQAEGRCPPEDVGGPPGYSVYLDAMADPRHERHDEFIQWRGPGFDPNVIDAAALTADVLALARTWSARPARKSS